jgi:uncharacterized oligopeptide transporter (OPT) family protein
MSDRAAPAELTLRATVLGLVLGLGLAAANVYAGLKLGFVDAGTTTVVVVAFAAFGSGRRRFTAQEVNVAQVTGSSAGAMAVTAGLIGPIPALAMTGHTVAPAVIVVWGAALAVFGTLAAIPFRDSLIVVKRLAFPSARAAGEVIRGLFADGDHARGSVRLLATAAVLAAAMTVARDALALVPGGWMLPLSLAGIPAAQLSIGVAASPLLVGTGLLVGARIGLSMLLGTAVAWLVLGPLLVHAGVATPSYPSIVSWTLWPGAALMVASSLTKLVLGGRALVRAFRGRSAVVGAATRWVRIALGLAAVSLIAIAWRGFGVSPAFGALAVVLAAVFSVAAMHATGETDHTPAGPLGGLTQIIVGAVGPGGIPTPLHAGGIVNGAAVHASTMLNAWKTGDVVGDGSPPRLVVAQLAGVVGGALAGVAAYWLVREAYGLGTTAMPAPGAVSWKATAEAVAGGTASMPAGAPIAALAGALAGILLAVLEHRPRLARGVPSAIAIGIGFIVPASSTVTVALGALAFAAIARRAPAWYERRGPPLASGLLLGEAFAGVVIAAIAVLRGIAWGVP